MAIRVPVPVPHVYIIICLMSPYSKINLHSLLIRYTMFMLTEIIFSIGLVGRGMFVWWLIYKY